MNTSGPYIIDGTAYTKKALEIYCREMAGEPLRPQWYRELFSFVFRYLNPAAGPILQQTSGTTGDPKEYSLNRKAMATSATKTLRFFDLHPGQRVLHCLPVRYIAGKMMVVRAMEGGLDLVLTEPSSRPLENTSGEFQFSAMVPLQVHESLKAGDDLSILRKLLIGGGELHPALKKKLLQLHPPHVFESFAMTETYTHFALRQVNGPGANPGFDVLDGVRISSDDRGCLVVEVQGITTGPVVTNDLVEIGKDGNRFRWLGRFDHVINTGGIKVIPEILEERISRILGMECLILPRPDEKLGQIIVLLVESLEDEPPVDKWLVLIRGHLTSHEVPKQIIAVSEIPRNASFKPDRRIAQELF